MKKVQIVLLILIAAAIAVLISFLKTSPTYDTVEIAKSKPGKPVSLIAKLDKSQPVDYDYKNPNYLSFFVIDSLGGKVRVVYHNPKPDNLEHSERLVLKGSIQNDHFECKEILMKCPSKYKDEMKMNDKNMPTSMASPADKTTPTKY
ncbi:MAG: cytochrome c maturation protein CcmE [Bacteroidetes bacterium]|nr:cytochrome c maturation protein CcmE [Bacteroidota bacterium]